LITELLKRYSSKEGYDLYPDVQGFFNKLQHYKRTAKAGKAPWPYDKTVIGVISNSDDRIPGILRSLGLKVGTNRSGSSSSSTTKTSSGDDIDFVALSYDVGHEKPDRRIFDAATEMLAETVASKDKGLNINDFDKLYVGDDLEKDYDGAKAAGWYAVLLDRGGVMKKAEKFRFGQVGMEDKDGKERKVLMARSLNDLELWPTKKTLDPSKV
jgi:FMN phosphatase YigB (HAD superfamily)